MRVKVEISEHLLKDMLYIMKMPSHKMLDEHLHRYRKIKDDIAVSAAAQYADKDDMAEVKESQNEK